MGSFQSPVNSVVCLSVASARSCRALLCQIY